MFKLTKANLLGIGCVSLPLILGLENSDPTRPIDLKPKILPNEVISQPEISIVHDLKAIIISSEKTTVIINDQVLNLGDQIDGEWVLTQIGTNFVKLLNSKGPKTIYLNESHILGEPNG